MIVLNEIKKFLRGYYRQGLMAASYLKIKTGRSTNTQLEIGSGPTQRAGWITSDMCKGADVY